MTKTVEIKTAGITLSFSMSQVVLGSTVPSCLYAIYEREWDFSRVESTLVFLLMSPACSAVLSSSSSSGRPFRLETCHSFFGGTWCAIQSHVFGGNETAIACCCSFLKLAVCGGLYRYIYQGSRCNQGLRGANTETPAAGRKIFPTCSSLFIFLYCASVIGWAYGANGMW